MQSLARACFARARFEIGHEFGDACAVDAPWFGRRARPRVSVFDFALQLIDAGAVGFIDDEDVGDFHDAGFDGLDVVAHAGNEHDYRHVGKRRDIDFILTDADGFDDDEIEAGGAEEAGEQGTGAGESAGCAARGHGADEDAGIGMVALHADAIAEDRAAGCAAGGIDGDDGDGLSAAAEFGGQCVDERALTRAGRTGDADDEAVAFGQIESGKGAPFSICVARRASSRASIQSFNSWRAMTRRWISLVPSPMVQSLTSR